MGDYWHLGVRVGATADLSGYVYKRLPTPRFTYMSDYWHLGLRVGATADLSVYVYETPVMSRFT